MTSFQTKTRNIALDLTFIGVAACGGGGGGGGSSSPPGSSALAGTWVGSEMLADGLAMVELRIVVNSKNKITSILIDKVDQGGGGSITPHPSEKNIYDVLLDDGTEAGFFLDPTGKHAVFVDEDHSFGVLQKGASGMAVPDLSKLGGKSYVGTSCLLTDNFEIDQLDRSAQAGVLQDGSFQGSHFGLSYKSIDGGGQLENQGSCFIGYWEASDNSVGAAIVIPSQDHQMYGIWAIDLDQATGEYSFDFSDNAYAAMARK